MTNKNYEMERQEYNVKKEVCNRISAQIKEFIDCKYARHDRCIETSVFDTLLGSNYDHQAELWRMKSVFADLMEAFTKPEIKEVLGTDGIAESVKWFRRLIEFSDRLQEEHAKAELDKVLIDTWGTDHFEASLNLQKEYAIKNKLATYEKQLELESETK